MDSIKDKIAGFLVCFVIGVFAWFLGGIFPVAGGPVIAIIIGMIISSFVGHQPKLEPGIKFTSKKILQYAVILLGFGLNLRLVLETGRQSLPIIITNIATALIIAYILSKLLKMPPNISTLIGVGSSICGGSAIAATAPVINARDEEVAQAISVIFFFNVIAALVFPSLGAWLGFSTSSGEAFGIFAGTAINDTSSVTAAASTWDNLYNLGSSTLDKAVTVKLTRTLAIIPITLGLGLIRAKDSRDKATRVNIRSIFPMFIIYFILASLITTIATSMGISPAVFGPFKDLSKFFIILAMAAIGLNTNIVKLIKSGGKPLLLGFSCWLGITLVSLLSQSILNIW